MKNKKFWIAIISVVALALVIIGVTYAYWLVTKTQTNSNVISTGCLDITLNGEANDINLPNQFPMSDEDGMKLTPYEFTITNNCTTSVDYYINLEGIGTENESINADALKVSLNDKVTILGDNYQGETTIENAYASYRLGYGTLAGSSDVTTEDTATYNLRIWIEADAPISEMNKTFTSKISVTIGQGINNPIKEGTLAYSLVSAYSESGITTLSDKWTVGVPAAESSRSVGVDTQYWYGTDYKFDSESQKFKLSGTMVQSTLADCRSGVKNCGEYTLLGTEQTYESRALQKITSFTNVDRADTTSTLFMTTQMIGSKNGFSTGTGAGEASMHTAIDDYGTSYYFRGDVTNNYVQFGAYEANTTVNGTTYSEETPMYWRIVRINGDGTIRLIYDGTEKIENGNAKATADIGTSAFGRTDDNPIDAGYTYDNGSGVQRNSIIKGALDSWYNIYIKTNYGKYIADSIFCNDKEGSYYYEDQYYNQTDKENAVYTDINYGWHTRSSLKSPTLQCKNQSDRYTVEDTEKGNGYLTNPVGLITADEVLMAGFHSSSNNNYLYTNNNYWTATPYHWDDSVKDLRMAYISSYSGTIGSSLSTGTYEVRPVINLKADVQFEGNGSYETPYIIK